MDDEASRMRILTVLKESPGLSTRGIARSVALNETTADYHLRRLHREGRVTLEPVGREVRWFGAGCGLCPVLRSAIPEFRREPVARVAAVLGDLPTAATAIAQRTGIEILRVRSAIDTLEGIGIVEKSSMGRPMLRRGAAVCRAKANAREACDQWGRCEVSRALTGVWPAS